MSSAGAEQAQASGTVTIAIQGKGDVTAAGIDCNETGGPDCSQFYANTAGPPDCSSGDCIPTSEPPTVEFTAGADRNGYTFNTWTGCDEVTLRVCTLTVTGSTTLTASFVDTQKPSVSGLLPVSGSVFSTDVPVSASATDNAAVQRVDFKAGGGTFVSDTFAPYGGTYGLGPNPVQGERTLTAMAFDSSGLASDPATTTITIDTVAPEVSIDTGPDGDLLGAGEPASWTFSASDATSGVATRECSVVPTGDPPDYGACSGDPTSHTAPVLADGNYTFSFRATDEGGLQTTASRSFSVDATAPNTSITSGPPAGSTQAASSVTFGFTSPEAGSVFECRLYLSGTTAPAFEACSDPGSHSATLSPGTYVFNVRARDAAGNLDPTPAARTFTIDPNATTDADPPSTTILKGPKPVVKTKKKKAKAKFIFESDEAGSSFECSLDGGQFESCVSPLKIKVKRGKHVLAIRATDPSGNAEARAAEHSWKVKRKKR